METSPASKKIPVVIQDLSKTFNVSAPWLNRVLERKEKQFLQAVQEVKLSIPYGKTFSLVGESGCGKSTVAKLLAGLINPSEGSILFEEVDFTKLKKRKEMQPYRAKLQMIFQDPYASLNPRWRVMDIIAEPLRVFKVHQTEKEIEAHVVKLLEQVGLSGSDRKKYPHEFSGGQRQRISVARALSSKPEILICDEPTSALDVCVQAQILNLMRELQKELKLTYLFISHDLAVVYHVSDYVGVMYLGRIVEQADVETLFNNPQHPYTRMLLSSVLQVEGKPKQSGPIEGEVPNPINPPSGCSFHPRCPYTREICQTKVPPFQKVGKATIACHGVAEGWAK